MTARLAHRGPDGSGLWADADVVLGHSRLAVVDPTGGTQPMTRRFASREYAITYNGELYNSAELRDRLAARGHKFRSRSDTELLLLTYVEFGIDCLALLNGIFAFAIYDQQARSLFLARDRLGVKPLFYTWNGETFLFASEIKALFVYPGIQPTVGREGLAELLLMFPARTPGKAIYEHISELRPGEWLRITPGSQEGGRYWHLPPREAGGVEPESVHRLRNLLRESVQRQLLSDVSVCCLLSGGLDSSTITALAVQSASDRPAPLRTYSLSVSENARHYVPNAFHPSADEPFVEELVTALGTQHQTISVTTADILQALPAVVEARDLPGMGDIDAALLLLCRAVKPEATVALSGEGADELFGGYAWALELLGGGQRRFPWVLLGYEQTWLLRKELREWLQPERYLAGTYESALAEMPSAIGDAKEQHAARLQHLLISRFLPALLERKDRMSMATGVEVRVPFCDHRLVELAWSIPWSKHHTGGVGKALLRAVAADLLPSSILVRPKSPFPSSYDPMLIAQLRAYLKRQLSTIDAPVWEIFDRKAVQALISSSPQSLVFYYLLTLSFLVQCNLWLQKYGVSLTSG